MCTGSQAIRLIGAGVLSQPIKLHHGWLWRWREGVCVRVGRSDEGGDRMGSGDEPQLSGGPAEGDHARLHRPAGRALHRPGEGSGRGRRLSVPDVLDQQPYVQNRHVQPSSGVFGWHCHRPGPKAWEDGHPGHGWSDYPVLPVSGPRRRVRLGYGPARRCYVVRLGQVYIDPESRRLWPVGHARGTWQPRRRSLDTRE